ncbi:hypothetical protein L6164_036313 [Bauhinia variegata]|uniref:Uncharacterized protein n=1 Tax=Bauhinia variegata TaxID=167791 RepID=A0ACB9KGN6_BAUVA|nr:hypothetical protein L6164_036313 [Bauhinia variegata]
MGSSSRQSAKQHELDCQHIHHYISGNAACNNQRLLQIMLQKKFHEFKFIRQTYFALYSQDLHHVLSIAQRNKPFAKAAYLRMSEPQERDAEIMRNSIFGGSLNLNTLIEIICTRSSSDLQCIKQTYRSRYNSDLEQDVHVTVKGGYREILMAVLNSTRYYGCKVDTSRAMCDAKTLYEAVESGKTIDQKTILSLLSQRNSGQLRAILGCFKHLYGHEFSKSIKQSKCGQFGRELRIVIRCMQSPEKFFAKLLRMKSGDARELIIRIVVTRSEIDIKLVSKAFAAKTGISLENFIRREFNSTKDKKNETVVSFLVSMIKG